MEKLNVILLITEKGELISTIDFTKDNVGAELNKALQEAPMQPYKWVRNIYTVEYPSKTPVAVVDGTLKPTMNNYGAWAGNTILFRESMKYEYVKSAGTRADYEDSKYWNLRTADGIEFTTPELKPYMDRYKKLKEVTDAFISDAKDNGILDELVTHVFYIRTYKSVKDEADKKALEKAEKNNNDSAKDITTEDTGTNDSENIETEESEDVL